MGSTSGSRQQQAVKVPVGEPTSTIRLATDPLVSRPTVGVVGGVS